MLDEDGIRRSAHILGPASAAAKAIAEAERRRANGEENTVVFMVGNTIIVGPVFDLSDNESPAAPAGRKEMRE